MAICNGSLMGCYISLHLVIRYIFSHTTYVHISFTALMAKLLDQYSWKIVIALVNLLLAQYCWNHLDQVASIPVLQFYSFVIQTLNKHDVINCPLQLLPQHPGCNIKPLHQQAALDLDDWFCHHSCRTFSFNIEVLLLT